LAKVKLIVRSGSGKWHAYYSWGGERRRIRPWGDDLPIDILGGGVVIAPPSRIGVGQYKIVSGHLDNLDRLRQATWLTEKHLRQPQLDRDIGTGMIHDGRRGEAVWRHCMKTAKSCDSLSLDTLYHAARAFDAANCIPPIATDAGGDRRLLGVAKSALAYTERGANRFGAHGVFFFDDEYIELLTNNQDALLLLGFLRSHNGPCAEFLCTNTLNEKFGWPEERLAAARRSLIDLGYITQTKKAGRGHAAKFKWTPCR
jgi:hypothetical protein